jgi:hypothetical protein
MAEHDGIWLCLTWELELDFRCWDVPRRLQLIRAVRSS